MTLENPYQPPATPAATPHSVFSRDEWLYMAKVFSAWLLGGSLLIALVVTGQFYLALSQFGGEEYVGRVVALAIPGQYGAILVMIAAANTLVMVTHRRTKSGILDPAQSIPWAIVPLLTFLAPLMIAWMLALSLFSSAILFGIPWDHTWTSMRQGLHFGDAGRAMFTVFLSGIILVFFSHSIMRRLARIQGRLLLKILLTSQAMGLCVYLLQAMTSVVS